MAPAPTNLLLTGGTINESDLVGVAVGQLTALGSTGQTLASTGLTFALVAGPGDNDNNRFRLSGDQLLANAVFDREVSSQLKIRIRVSDADGQAFDKAFSIAVNNLPNPVVTAPLSSAPLAWDDGDRQVALDTGFDDPFSTGKVVTFQLAPVEVAGNSQASLGSGQIRVLLFDQPGQGAPLTTANLETYITAGRYNNTFIHRAIPGFVLQGGGFNLVNAAQVQPVSTFPAVQNEYSAGRSNLRGTLAMAKQGSNPNSATSQWFWSLADNSANLDNQNGGFTVFGRVLGEADLRTLDAMAAVPILNKSTVLGPTFSELPLSNGILNSNNLLQFSGITISQQPELRYTLIHNSAPDLLQATITADQLVLHPLANQQQQVSLTIRATSLLGESVDQSLNLQLLRRPTTNATISRFDDTAANLAQPTLIGGLAAPLRADERVRILADGIAIGEASAATGSRSWSFQPTTPLSGGSDGQLELSARVESLDGVAGTAAPNWTLGLNPAGSASLKAPGSELITVVDPQPLEVQATPIGHWGAGFMARNAGSVTAAGTLRPGTGQRIAVHGLDRYGLSLRNAEASQVSVNLGNGNHAFFLHDSWTDQSSALGSQIDANGRRTAARFDQLHSIRMGDCDAAGATSLVDLTSADFLIGPITVYGGQRAGSRNVIWTSAADDTIICGGADSVIFGGGGRNALQLSTGSDRLQYVANGDANDLVSQFNPSQDVVELWGLPSGTLSNLSIQSDGNGGSVLSWQGNRVTFSGTMLTLPSGGELPSWITRGV